MLGAERKDVLHQSANLSASAGMFPTAHFLVLSLILNVVSTTSLRYPFVLRVDLIVRQFFHMFKCLLSQFPPITPNKLPHTTFNNFSSYYLQLYADDYMFPCSQSLISLHMLNTLGPSRGLCAERLALCHHVFLKEASPAHIPATWEPQSELLKGAPMGQWPGDICPWRKGSREKEKEGLYSILAPRGEPRHECHGREMEVCIYQIPSSSNIRDESLVLNEKLL